MAHKKKNKALREDTWVGYRPSVMQAHKNDKKKDRQKGKKECKEYVKDNTEYIVDNK